jgi:hypothetical protein
VEKYLGERNYGLTSSNCLNPTVYGVQNFEEFGEKRKINKNKEVDETSLFTRTHIINHQSIQTKTS